MQQTTAYIRRMRHLHTILIRDCLYHKVWGISDISVGTHEYRTTGNGMSGQLPYIDLSSDNYSFGIFHRSYAGLDPKAVSYPHLDVYKRQTQGIRLPCRRRTQGPAGQELQHRRADQGARRIRRHARLLVRHDRRQRRLDRRRADARRGQKRGSC